MNVSSITRRNMLHCWYFYRSGFGHSGSEQEIKCKDDIFTRNLTTTTETNLTYATLRLISDRQTFQNTLILVKPAWVSFLTMCATQIFLKYQNWVNTLCSKYGWHTNCVLKMRHNHWVSLKAKMTLGANNL